MTVGKVLKFSYRAIVIVMVIALIAGLLINRATEAESGSFTALSSPMSSADKKWVHETFDGYETFEELLYDGMIPFVTSNFVYDSDYNRHFLVIQQFNFNQFRQDDFHGVCYQFAQWAKSVVTELYGCEVRCYIADVRLNRNYYKTHSYNYFIVEDTDLNLVDMVVWNKCKIGMGFRTRRKSEYLIVCQKSPVRAKGKWTIHNIPDVWDEKTPKLHPHSKPLELQKALIEATTQEGDWILDPAAGGYSVLTACQELNRNFIGCDIEFGEEPHKTERCSAFLAEHLRFFAVILLSIAKRELQKPLK